jgi:hypothetical protein
MIVNQSISLCSDPVSIGLLQGFYKNVTHCNLCNGIMLNVKHKLRLLIIMLSEETKLSFRILEQFYDLFTVYRVFLIYGVYSNFLFYGMSVKNFIVLLCGRSKTCLKLGEKNV